LPPQDPVRLESHPLGVVVPINAQPAARTEGIAGVHDGALKIAVKQVPEKGKANKGLAEFLARVLGVSRSQVELVSGVTSRRKRFLVQGVTAPELAQRLTALLDRTQ
jgi:hypothetical protein